MYARTTLTVFALFVLTIGAFAYGVNSDDFFGHLPGAKVLIKDRDSISSFTFKLIDGWRQEGEQGPVVMEIDQRFVKNGNMIWITAGHAFQTYKLTTFKRPNSKAQIEKMFNQFRERVKDSSTKLLGSHLNYSFEFGQVTANRSNGSKFAGLEMYSGDPDRIMGSTFSVVYLRGGKIGTATFHLDGDYDGGKPKDRITGLLTVYEFKLSKLEQFNLKVPPKGTEKEKEKALSKPK